MIKFTIDTNRYVGQPRRKHLRLLKSGLRHTAANYGGRGIAFGVVVPVKGMRYGNSRRVFWKGFMFVRRN